MRIFKEFNEKAICPICGTNENKSCVLVGMPHTQEGNNMQAKAIHIDCINLTMFREEDKSILVMAFKELTSN